MRRAGLAAAVTVALTVAPASAGAREARGQYAGRLLTDVLKELQGKELRIVYSSTVVGPDMRVKAEPRARGARQILDELLAQHGLTTEKGPGGALIVVRAVSPDSGGRPREPDRGAAAIGSIKGRIVDATTGAPLAGVVVQVVGTALETRSDDQGRFELVGVAAGSRTLFVSIVGYALIRRDVTVDAGATLEITIPLAPGTGTYTEEVTVSAGPFATREPAAPAEMTLGSGELQNLRGVLADDPLRAVQALPSVATGDDFRSEFSVRGLGYRNVGVSIDGVSTPWLVHAVYGRDTTGSVAMINSDVLDQATLLAGAHPRRHADRAGAELDFTMRPGSRERFGLRGAVSGTNAAAVFEGPLGRAGRGSWIASIRQSYLDLLIEAVDKGSAFGFTDAQSKFVYDLSPRQRVDFSVIAGRSRLEEQQEGSPGPNSLDHAINRTALANASWRSTFGSGIVLTQRAYFVHHTFRNVGVFGQEQGRGTDRELAYKASVTVSRSPSALVEAGAHLLRIEGSQRLTDFSLVRNGLVQSRVFTFDDQGWQRSAYVHLQWTPAAPITIAPGVRVARDTFVDQDAVSPWLLTEWRVASAWSLRVAGGVSHQYPDMTQLFGPGGSTSLVPERARTLDVAVEHRIGNSIRWRVGAYARDDRRFLRLEDSEVRLQGGQIVRPPGPGDWRNALDGTARGLELMVQRESAEGLSGWVAYSYGRTRYDDDSTGEGFWGDFDQRHAFTLYAQYRLTDRTAFLAKFRGGSNFPIPGYLEERGDGFVVADARNLARLPYYARLDLRANRTFNYDRRRLTLFVEVLNVLNRTNARPSGDYAVRANGEALGVTETLFPLLPSAGILIEF
jgi:hypothetical protein